MADSNVQWMRAAIQQARQSLPEDVPVGAVIVKGDTLVSSGYNRRERVGNVLLHAEVVALAAACESLGGWNLSGCTAYVTLEPCPMCAGALAQARIDRVVYGAFDLKTGALGSVCDLYAMPFPHVPLVIGGVLERECVALLRDFFRGVRNQRGR